MRAMLLFVGLMFVPPESHETPRSESGLAVPQFASAVSKALDAPGLYRTEFVFRMWPVKGPLADRNGPGREVGRYVLTAGREPGDWSLVEVGKANGTIMSHGACFDANLRTRVASYKRVAIDPFNGMLNLFMQQQAIVDTVSVDSLAQAVSDGEIRDLRVREDGAWQCVFTVHREDQAASEQRLALGDEVVRPDVVRRVAVAFFNGKPGLTELELTFAEGGDGRPLHQMRVAVETWGESGELQLPKCVSREVVVGTKRSRELLERVAFEPIAPEDAPVTPICEGWTIQDEVADIVFEVGSTDITVKGKTFRLKDRLWNYPISGLAELLESATSID